MTEQEFQLELAAIDKQRNRFRYLSFGAIAVSFLHIFYSIEMFSRGSFAEKAAAVGLTILLDAVPMFIAGYLFYAKRRGLSRGFLVYALLFLGLSLSMLLNGMFMWTMRPPVETLPTLVSGAFAVAFAVFIPMTIGVQSLVMGELEDDRVVLQSKYAEEQAKKQAKTQPRVTISKPASSPLQKAIESGNHLSLPAPDESAALQPAGGKAAIATSDATGIRNALRESGLSVVKSAEQLRRCCGAESSSSGPRYLRTALESGILSPLESGGYQVLSVD